MYRSEDRIPSVDTFLLCWLVGLGFFIRIWGLWEYHFSPDECLIYLISKADSLSGVWKAAFVHDHPPLMDYILHFLMKVSENQVFLRLVSIIPGAGSIVMFYLLGTHVSGRASGITMALIATFSFGMILVSEVIRTYALFTFLFTLAMFSLFSFISDKRRKFLFVYVGCMTVCMALHYAAIIPVIVISAFLLCRMLIERRPAGDYVSLLYAHLPLIAVTAILFVFHLYPVLKRPDNILASAYLQPFYPRYPFDWIRNIYDFYSYAVLPPLAIPAIVLSVGGFIVCLKTRKDVSLIFAGIIMVNVALTLLRKYPFGGIRQSIYLLPLVAISIGASVQYITDEIRRKTRPGKNKGHSGTSRTASVPKSISIVCLIVITLLIAYDYKKSDFLRQYKPGSKVIASLLSALNMSETISLLRLSNITKSYTEFPVRRESFDIIMNYLAKHLRENDLILTNYQVALYLRYEGAEESESASDLKKIKYHGRTYYAAYPWSMRDDQIWNAMRSLVQKEKLSETSRIWFVQMGWGGDLSVEGTMVPEEYIEKFVGKSIFRDPFYINMIEEKLLFQGASAAAFPSEAVLKELDRRH